MSGLKLSQTTSERYFSAQATLTLLLVRKLTGPSAELPCRPKNVCLSFCLYVAKLLLVIVIVEEIKQKFCDKECSEIRYIKTHLKEFDAYEARRAAATIVFEEDDSHERSRGIIELWRNARKLKGYVVQEDVETFLDGGIRKKGHGKGKSKLFQFECIATPPGLIQSTYTTPGSQSSTDTTGRLSSSSSIHFSDTQYLSSASSSGFGYSSSSSQSSSSSLGKRASSQLSLVAGFSMSQESPPAFAQHDESLYDDVQEEEQDEYALPPTLKTKKAILLEQHGKVKEARYETTFKERGTGTASDNESDVEDIQDHVSNQPSDSETD
jgi:hypothetical protein